MFVPNSIKISLCCPFYIFYALYMCFLPIITILVCILFCVYTIKAGGTAATRSGILPLLDIID